MTRVLNLKPYELLAVVEMAAGSPVEFLPFLEWREIRLPSWAHENDRFFVARVCGDSLLNATRVSVQNGDYALVHLTGDVRDGDLAAILTPEGMMLKFVYREGEQVRLESRHPNFPTRHFDASDVVVQGRVVRTEHDW
jgi:SOS-response transcriptional repressor LexA